MELDEPLSEQPPFLLFTKWTHQKTLRSLEVSLLKKKFFCVQHGLHQHLMEIIFCFIF